MKTRLELYNEIRSKYTDKDIMDIFNEKGIYHSVINDKKSKNNGMLFIVDKYNDAHQCCGYISAYIYLLQTNKI